MTHVSKDMEGKNPQKEDRMGPVDSSTAKTLQRDAILAAMLQEIADRELALRLSWDELRAVVRREKRREWWEVYRTCSCRRETEEEEKSD